MLNIKNKGKIISKRVLNIAKDLCFHKAEDVVVYDVRNKTPHYSYLIVCSANNERKVSALSNSAADSVFNYYKHIKNIEGKNGSKWIVVDAYDTIVHIFESNEREKMKFDALYVDCPHKVIEDKTRVPKTRSRDDKKK